MTHDLAQLVKMTLPEHRAALGREMLRDQELLAIKAALIRLLDLQIAPRVIGRRRASVTK